MKNKTFVITDTHFGVKQNSTTWLNAQLAFFDNEFIPALKREIENGYAINVVHCGDVFDSRSSINPYVAQKVRELFYRLQCICDVYIVAGNHDFYSPNSDEYSALNLILGDLGNVIIVKTGIFATLDNDNVCSLYVPWYKFTYDDLKQSIEKYHPKRIFCHTDLTNLDESIVPLLNGIDVFSGHIHAPFKKKQLVNLGSTFALTFADCNSERGYYVLDKQSCWFYAAQDIIKFWRFNDEEILCLNAEPLKNDYVELYVNKLNLLNQEYSSKISELGNTIRNLTVIPTDSQTANESIEFKNYDIEELCRENVPDELREKFETIANKQ